MINSDVLAKLRYFEELRERKDRERLNQRPPELTPEDLRKMWEAWEEFRVMNEAMLDRVAEEQVITATMVRAMEEAR